MSFGIKTMSNGSFWGLWSLAMAAVLGGMIWAGEHLIAWARFGAAFGFTAGIILLALLAAIRSSRHRKGGIPPAARRYILRLTPAMLAYVASLFLSIWAFRTLELTGGVAIVVATAPALPIIVAIWAVGRFIVETEDEFERAAIVQAQMWGLGATLAICSVVGFLDSFGVIPHVPLWVAFPLHAACSGLANIPVRARYR